MSPVKTCKVCLKVKKLEEFHTHNRSSDGHTHTCKSCKPDRPRWNSVEFRNPAIKKDSGGGLLKINKELIDLCQDYKKELSKSKKTISDQKTALDNQARKLEHYTFEEQKRVTKSLRKNLEAERLAAKDR